ncbi:MAG: IclR family transcriptional regulator [Caldilineaceae bacterium]|nr:IclR family transcriptional regulator [Caldilineaceae bacterium]
MDASEKVTAIEKALALLLAFVPQNTAMGTTELSDKLGYHKATTSRILLTLTAHGFLQQNPVTKKFSLGRSIQTLGSALTTSLTNNFVEIAKPYVDTLRSQLEEDVGLEIWSGAGTTWLYSAENSQPVRISSRQGRSLPFYAAAGAKAIVAFAPTYQLDALLQQPLTAFTPATTTDPAAFRQQLCTFRQQGYAVDNEELRIGISALAAPIFNHQGTAFAAVVVIMPTQRIDSSTKSPQVCALKATAAAISAQFYYEAT